jgi:transposase
VETDPIRVCELLVGLPNVNVLGVEDGGVGLPLRLHVEIRAPRPMCDGCGSVAEIKDRPQVELADLPAFGRPVRLVWRKHRWRCPDPTCPTGSWTGMDRRIAASRLGLTDRAGRWATRQVGKDGRTARRSPDRHDRSLRTAPDRASLPTATTNVPFVPSKDSYGKMFGCW